VSEDRGRGPHVANMAGRAVLAAARKKHARKGLMMLAATAARVVAASVRFLQRCASAGHCHSDVTPRTVAIF